MIQLSVLKVQSGVWKQICVVLMVLCNMDGKYALIVHCSEYIELICPVLSIYLLMWSRIWRFEKRNSVMALWHQFQWSSRLKKFANLMEENWTFGIDPENVEALFEQRCLPPKYRLAFVDLLLSNFETG